MRSQYSSRRYGPFLFNRVPIIPSRIHYAIQYSSGYPHPHATSPLTPNAHAFYHHYMHHSQHPAHPTTNQSAATPVPAPLPCPRTRDPHPIPNSPSTPHERDKFFVAGSDTNVRQMRQISALQNPSPATALSPFAAICRRSPDTKLPRVRQRFPSWPRYNHETMRQLSDTKNSPQLRFLSRQLRTLAQPPVFAATKPPGMRQAFRSWLRYNHETNETATPGTATCVRSQYPTHPKHSSREPRPNPCDIVTSPTPYGGQE